jgi:hypothetical protein
MTRELSVVRGGVPSLEWYDRASAALERACSIDEVKNIHDQAVAVTAYANQARNRTLEANAVVIRLRAERCGGELIARMAAAGQINQGRPTENRASSAQLNSSANTTTLGAMGVDHHLAARMRRVAAIPRATFNDTLSDVVRPHVLAHGVHGTDRLVDVATRPDRDDRSQRRARRRERSIDDAVAQAGDFWDRLAEGEEMKVLAEIARFKSEARRTGLDYLVRQLRDIIRKLTKIEERLL